MIDECDRTVLAVDFPVPLVLVYALKMNTGRTQRTSYIPATGAVNSQAPIQQYLFHFPEMLPEMGTVEFGA